MSQGLLPGRGFRMQRAVDKRERPVQQQILAWLESEAIPAWQPRANLRHGQRGSVGLPDVLGALPWGQAFAIEVKRGDGKGQLRTEQAAWIVRTLALSPWTAVILAASVADVERALGGMIAAWRELGYDAPGVFWWQAVEPIDAPWRVAKQDALRAAVTRLRNTLLS